MFDFFTNILSVVKVIIFTCYLSLVFTLFAIATHVVALTSFATSVSILPLQQSQLVFFIPFIFIINDTIVSITLSFATVAVTSTLAFTIQGHFQIAMLSIH